MASALQRISERLDGLWFDPYGDLESDIRSVISSIESTPPSQQMVADPASDR